jgi:antitoxin component of MazEF toxin-antitoxin module
MEYLHIIQREEERFMTRHLQKIGNSRGLVLSRTMLDHLGVTDEIEVKLEEGKIVIMAPNASVSRQRENFQDALETTFTQYDETMQRLADAS